jgi:hypothetical protein
MAKTTKVAPKKFKPKAITKGPAKAALTVVDMLVPKTALDAATYAVPWAKGARMVGGITKKGAKAVSKVYRNIGK